MTQLALDVLFRSIGSNILDGYDLAAATDSLQASDPSEAAVVTAQQFLDAIYGDPSQGSRSRAATPMIVRQSPVTPIPCTFPESRPPSPKSLGLVGKAEHEPRKL